MLIVLAIVVLGTAWLWYEHRKSVAVDPATPVTEPVEPPATVLPGYPDDPYPVYDATPRPHRHGGHAHRTIAPDASVDLN